MKSVVAKWLVVTLLLFKWSIFSTQLQAGVTVKLAWDPTADPDVNGYNVYFGEVGGTVTNQMAVGASASGAVVSLSAGKSYFSYVTALSNSGGESQPSNFVNYQPTAPVLTNPPVIGSILDQGIPVGSQLSMQLTATESGATAPVFAYSLVSGPVGMSVNAASGVLTWAPTVFQAPSTNRITVQVTDNNTPPLSSTTSFSVVVMKPNTAPTFTTVGTHSFSENTTLDLVTNGSFESGYTNWTMTGNQRIDNAAATDGLQAVRFNSGQSTPNGVLSQTLATVPGQQYVLSFDLGAFSLLYQNAQSLAVTLQGTSTVLSRTFSVTAPGNGTRWVPQSATFIADSATTVLTFQDVSPTTDSVDLWLDNVHLIGSAPGVTLTAAAGQTLSASITAIDLDTPPQILTYSVTAGPAGSTIDPATGLFSWTPTLAQAKQTFPVTVQVSDNGSPSLSDKRSFSIYVSGPNAAPVLASVQNLLATVGSQLTWQLSAVDPDVPGQALTYSLVSGPAGAGVNSTNGLFSWTPSSTQASITATVTVRVTDNGSPALSDTKSFSVAVMGQNTAPMISLILDQTISEGVAFSFKVPAADRDLPAQSLTYSLVSGPVGAALDSAAGMFTWTPTEAQGPSTNKVVVQVTDNGTPRLSTTGTFNIIVREVNRTPVLNPIANQIVSPGQILMLSLIAWDPDLPVNILSYRLVSGPSAIKVDPISGVLTWRLSKSEPNSTNIVTVGVSDNGSPSLSSTTSFTVIVSAQRTATIQSPAQGSESETVHWVAEVAPGQDVHFTHSIIAAKLNGQLTHYLEASEDLANWVTVGIISTASELRDVDAASTPTRFYRIRSEEGLGTSATAATETSAN